ncbi:MAG: carbamoyltransferase N-terminal domain-containing protein [Acidimicrobiales bacterium]
MGGPARAVLGISADYHDSAAALLVDGRLVAAAAEERFTRRKHDRSLPVRAMAWMLDEHGIGPDDLAMVAFYEKPLTVVERILATHARVGPRGLPQLTSALAAWTREKGWIGYRIERALRRLGRSMPELVYVEHHLSHAAAAFLPSPFERAAILTFDGVGEWATSSIAIGRGGEIEPIEELRFPDSVGLLYSTITAHCGFEVNDGEYKLMGLAPYGRPRYADVLRERVAHVDASGALALDQRWFRYRAGDAMASPALAELLGPPRAAGEPLAQRHADLARSVQVVVEDLVLAAARHAAERTGERDAVLAGGVALNCVANGRLLREGPFERLWVQPAAGDDGSAVGAALWAWHHVGGHERAVDAGGADAMAGAALGPSYDRGAVRAWLDDIGIAHRAPEPDALVAEVARRLASGEVVGWFDGPMEFGPRALGHRSILADPRDRAMVQRVNLLVKGREGFRPFAPAVLASEAARWFDVDRPLPYMLFTAAVRDAVLEEEPDEIVGHDDLARRLGRTRSAIPACTHVDGSARVQTVHPELTPRFAALLEAFEAETGCPVLLNTSFNRKDEPIVCTPADALRCFEAVDLDLLVIEGCLVERADRRAQVA